MASNCRAFNCRASASQLPTLAASAGQNVVSGAFEVGLSGYNHVVQIRRCGCNWSICRESNIKILSLQSGILIFVICFPAAYCLGIEDIHDVPNPRAEGRWVVDLTGSINQNDLNRVDDFCESINASHGFEFAVVVVNTTGNKSVEEFALQLFNLWGIGDPVERDGVLFLIAKNDRKMRIALGAGIDSKQEQATAKQIIDNEVTPRFKSGKFGEGIYAGTFATAARVLGVIEADLEDGFDVPAAIPMNLNRNGTRQPRTRQPRKRNDPLLPWLFGGGALGAGGVSLIGVRRWLRYRKRDCQFCGTELALLTDEQEDLFLDEAEITEEQIGSVDYDVWACRKCEDVNKVRYGTFFTKYSKCPECQYKTKFQVKTTIRAATRSHGGKVYIEERCENCDYHHQYYYTTPKLPAESSSSSFSSSSFSSGGGGGFSGGSSSGGGASGGW